MHANESRGEWINFSFYECAVFVAFNRTWDHSGDGIELLDSAIVAKLTYWWNP